MRPVSPDVPNGFILLEVLVAMSLILGVWMTSVGAYQELTHRLIQQESRRSQLWQTFDTHELAEQARVNLSFKDIKHESSRVSGRNRTLRTIAKSTTKN
jgi:Tfp pilus assembly protein PilV